MYGDSSVWIDIETETEMRSIIMANIPSGSKEVIKITLRGHYAEGPTS